MIHPFCESTGFHWSKCIVPQAKFTFANQHFGTVIIQHLDKLYNANKGAYKELLEQCRGPSSINLSIGIHWWLALAKWLIIECSVAKETEEVLIKVSLWLALFSVDGWRLCRGN
jgi:hypothetical protein